MDSDRELMLTHLSKFSTTLDTSYISCNCVQSLPNSCIHSDQACSNSNNNTHSCKKSNNNIHSCPDSNSNIHSCPNSNSNIHSCTISNSNVHSCTNNSNIHSYPNSNTTVHSCPNSSSNVHSCMFSIQNISTSACQPCNSQLGSNISCATSANLTPLPIKKFSISIPDSDADTDLFNVCRICQLPEDDGDALFSPCRCSGSLNYVHYSCLMKWIEISTRKTRKPPRCELCQFLYIRQKRFRFHNWHLPRVSSQDKCLHIMFLLTLVVMVTCAVATVLCFLSESGRISHTKSHLNAEEVITLSCGVLFFVSFFVAMTVEIKARHTIYRLFLKFLVLNTEWHIEPYDKSKDPDCPRPYIHL